MSKISRFSVSFGRQPEGGVGTEAIVLVPPKSRVDRGFALARQLLAERRFVRLIGANVTLKSTWPEWVSQSRGLTLTELGAYREESLVTAGAPVRRSVERWLDTLFVGELGELSGSDVFYGSAMVRIFERYHDEYPLLASLVAAHQHSEFFCSDASWDGARRLKRLLCALNGGLKVESQLRSFPWSSKVLGLSFVGMCASAVRVFDEARRAFATSTAFGLTSSANTVSPRTWIAITPTWLRANRHVIASVGAPVIDGGETLGVLLFGSLKRGARTETASGALEGDALWPGLGVLQAKREDCRFYQVSQPSSWGALARGTAKATRRSFLALIRTLKIGQGIAAGEYVIPLDMHVRELVTLLTVDVFRATIAEQATRAFLSREQVAGANLFFAASQLADTVVVDQLLQRANATTFEFHHGSIGDDWAGGFRPRSSVACVWTRSDARSIEELGQRALVARSMTAERKARSPRARPRVLVMTNYTHWGLRVDGTYPQLPLLVELFAGIDRVMGTRDVEVRWRPHPADDSSVVDQILDARGGIVRSTEANVLDDIAWADVIVASLSTTVVEALLLGHAPVIVHVPPEMVDITPTRFLRPERCFFRSEELVEIMTVTVDALVGGRNCLEPEEAARLELFERDSTSLLERARSISSPPL